MARTEEAPAVVAMSEDVSARESQIISLQDELKLKNEQIAAIEGKYKNLLGVFIVFVVGLVVGKMVLQ